TDQFGLRNADIDVTFTSLRMGYQVDPEEQPITLNRNVSQRDIDYDDLTRTHKVVIDVLAGHIDRDQARQEVARISSTGHWVPRWGVVVGSGVTGGGVAMLLGAGVLITAVAALASLVIEVMLRELRRRRLPMFYRQLAGGMFASLLAVGIAAVDPDTNPSRLITATIVLLLAGIGFMGAIQDALSGFYLTSSARMLEVVMATIGLIAGVAIGIALAPMVGVSLGPVQPGAYGLADAPVLLLGSAISGAAFAFTSYAPPRSLVVIAFLAALGEAVYTSIQLPGLSRSWSAGCAAFVIGLLSYSLAGRVKVPPLVVVVPALVPILPGLSIYRALSLMAANESRGVVALVGAAAVTISLAAGVILGEYLAQPLKRNARKIENRLSGPRMVGVLHGQWRRPGGRREDRSSAET
ncbi:MAG: threonine/serine ThrE exporter family protein, partial [Marmoricola sp.]